MVKVRSRSRRRISIAALTCYKPGQRSRLIYRPRKDDGRRDGRKSFSWRDYRDLLTIYYLPPYAPDLNPDAGIWSLLRRGWLSNIAFSTPEDLIQRIRRGLRHIQYRPGLIDGSLAETGLVISP
ncbi:transposase [Streptomyces sp. TR06-5]|uniref:transposase n=1 Tax=Streptomyces sp. TR06-5 TaxID=3385976 RepID=UPI00399F7BE5